MTISKVSYSASAGDMEALYEEISAVEEELNGKPFAKAGVKGNTTGIRRLVVSLSSSNTNFSEIQSVVTRALSDLRKPSAGYLEEQSRYQFMAGAPRESFRKRVLGGDLSADESIFPEEHEEKIPGGSFHHTGQGIAFNGVKIAGPILMEALHHTKFGKVSHFLETVVKTWLGAEEHGVGEAGCNLVIDTVLTELCGGLIMGSAEFAVFVAEHEDELLAAAHKIPHKFSDPAVRAELAAVSMDGFTPEGSKALAQALIGVIGPIGHVAKDVMHGMSHAVGGVVEALGEHGEGVQKERAYGAM